MKARTLVLAAVLLGLGAVPGCWVFEGSESGGSLCTGGPVTLAVPVQLFCAADRITGTVTGPGMTTIEASISPASPTVTLEIPSGEDRELVVRAYTTDDPDTPALTTEPVRFCVDAGQPVSIAVKVEQTNRDPSIDGVTPAGGQVTAGQTLALAAKASDPDACDAVKRYAWSTAYGTITGTGANASWVPACPSSSAGSCQASVALTVFDGRGGKRSASFEYTIGANNAAPTVSLASADGLAGRCWAVELTAAASDPDGDPLTLSWEIQSGQGSLSGVSGSGDTTAVWDSGCTTGAVDAVVRVTATDAAGASASATTRILNRAPTVSIAVGATVRGTNDVTYPLTATATDPDGGALRYRWTIDNAGAGSFSATGGAQTDFTIVDNSGTSTVRVTVTDARGAQGTATVDLPSVVTITVNDSRPGRGARRAAGR